MGTLIGSYLFVSKSEDNEDSLASTNNTGAKGVRRTWLDFGGGEVANGSSRFGRPSSIFPLEGASTFASGIKGIVLSFLVEML